MSSDKQTGKALIVLSLLCLVLGAVLQVHWLKVAGGVGLVCWYIDYSLLPTLRKRWHELLDAIRGRRQSSSEHGREQECERQIEAPYEETQYHIEPTPPGFQSRELTSDELERAGKAFSEREAQYWKAKAAREREAALEQERKKRDDEAREQEAREFLVRESERVQKEREEREAVQKREREAEANRTRWLH